MWSRFKEQKEQSITESSLNSTRLDALSGLLQNPTHYTVNTHAKEKHVESIKQKNEEKEKLEKLKEEQMIEKERLRKLATERSQRRHDLRQQKGCSEEESNGSYTEILMEEERKRERLKRETKKEEKRERRKRSPTKNSPKSAKKEESGKRKSPVLKDKGVVTNVKSRKAAAKHSDSMDTLFSIPEDASFEQSPTKAESEMKSRQKRQRHVIDPLMKKLRDKIKMQRHKIDKERRKELQRVEKLKRLEMLLTAKRKGRLSDKAIDVELEDVSSTSCLSHTESSHASESTLTALSSTDTSIESLSTTLQDSTVDSVIKLQVKRYTDFEFDTKHGKYLDSTDSVTESSDFSNIIVESVIPARERKQSKERTEKKLTSKKYKKEAGEKVRKSKKKKRDVFGVELTENDIANQLRRYETYMTPERQRRVRDACTMYPSPIQVSPPTRRKARDVLMKSEAIQTSPSVRSSSPTYAYDEVPVSPVPYMTKKSRSSKGYGQHSSLPNSVRTRSISPHRSQRKTTPTRKTSPSPVTLRNQKLDRSRQRKPSSSPVTRPTSGSPGRRRFSPPITRRQAQSPIWKPESETVPPRSSIFTPETDENMPPNSDKAGE